MATEEVSRLDLMSSLLKEHLAESTSKDIESFVPDDFMQIILEAIGRLHKENAPNIMYLFAKALATDREDSPLQVESVSFKLIHLMLLSIVETRMELLELFGMELVEELEILDWNKESILPGLNEILFPTHAVEFRMASSKGGKNSFVLKKCREEEESDNASEYENEEEMIGEREIKIEEIEIKPYAEDETLSEQDSEDDKEEETTEVKPVQTNKQFSKPELRVNPEDIIKVYKCMHCSFIVRQPEDMSKHMTDAHPDIKKVPITRMDDSTKNEAENLDEDMLTENEEIKTEAADPVEKPRRRKSRHKALKLDPEKTCSMCMRQFLTADEKQEHESRANCLNCPDCTLTFSTKASWIKHHRTEHGKKQSLCPFCCKEYRSCHLMRHIECVHYNIRKHECNKCGKGFFEKKERLKHESLCEPNSQPCTLCSEVLFNMGQLIDHVKLAHKMHMCKHCKKVCKDTKALRKHMLESHWLDKDPTEKICEQCGKVCQGMAMFRRHVKTAHRDEAAPEQHSYCQLCRKTFKGPYYLKRHIAIVHEKQKRYCCDVCGKGFASSAHLQEHVGVHDMIKRYVCEVCDEGFVHRASYKRHAVKHLGAQLFPCSICQRKFDTPCYLKNHVKRVHRGSSVEVMNFQYPGTSLPKHMRKRLVGGRPCNKPQQQFNSDNAQIEIAMFTNDDATLAGQGESSSTLPPAATITDYDTPGDEQIIEEISTLDPASLAAIKDEKMEEQLDLSSLQCIQVQDGEEGNTKVIYVPEGAQYTYIQIGNETII